MFIQVATLIPSRRNLSYTAALIRSCSSLSSVNPHKHYDRPLAGSCFPRTGNGVHQSTQKPPPQDWEDFPLRQSISWQFSSLSYGDTKAMFGRLLIHIQCTTRLVYQHPTLVSQWLLVAAQVFRFQELSC